MNSGNANAGACAGARPEIRARIRRLEAEIHDLDDRDLQAVRLRDFDVARKIVVKRSGIRRELDNLKASLLNDRRLGEYSSCYRSLKREAASAASVSSGIA